MPKGYSFFELNPGHPAIVFGLTWVVPSAIGKYSTVTHRFVHVYSERRLIVKNTVILLYCFVSFVSVPSLRFNKILSLSDFKSSESNRCSLKCSIILFGNIVLSLFLSFNRRYTDYIEPRSWYFSNNCIKNKFCLLRAFCTINYNLIMLEVLQDTIVCVLNGLIYL